MTVAWPSTDDSDCTNTYVQYAHIYDAIFSGLDDDLRFYVDCAEALPQPDAAVLELGSGTGRLTKHLLGAGARVTGVDASAEMLAQGEGALAPFAARYRGVHADVRKMHLGASFPLVIAAYGMVAHLLTDDDRYQAFRRVYEHLAPGGCFVFDDMPAWLAGPVDACRLDLRCQGLDPATGLPVRLMTNAVDVAGQPYTVRYDFIDWLRGERVERRALIRVVFRNIELREELALLARAGFAAPELLGGFDGRPFDHVHLERNSRLIIRCKKPS